MMEQIKKIWKKSLLELASWLLLALGCICIIYFVISIWVDEYRIFGSSNIDFAVTGQVGDFMGGVVGTLFSLSGTLLIFLTFKEQRIQYKKSGFETTFFELLNIHRDNVNQLGYSKYHDGEIRTAENRKVFRLIVQEYEECYNELRKFSESYQLDDIVLQARKDEIKKIINDYGLKKVSIEDFIYTDIAYCIIFFGVGSESENILESRFRNKYNINYTSNLLRFLKLKPKRENTKVWKIWHKLNDNSSTFSYILSEYLGYNISGRLSSLCPTAQKLVGLEKTKYYKYYGGHQHRLGHYFRHLFQSFKFVNSSDCLDGDEKKFYAKTLRAQLSTYEQAILFINSVSTLGWKWEFKPEDNSKLITEYGLIKNLQGYHVSGLKFKDFYPEIDYESDE